MSALDVLLGDLYREASHGKFPGGPRARTAFDAPHYYRCNFPAPRLLTEFKWHRHSYL
jgi:hypothetical protein